VANSKYDPLAIWLGNQSVKSVPVTFGQIEGILHFALPPTARERRAWWENDRNHHSQARAWLDPGFRTEDVNLTTETLTFVRS
jgi:hypothetical protein